MAQRTSKAKKVTGRAPTGGGRRVRDDQGDGPEATNLQVGGLPVIYERLDYLRSVIVGAWVEVGSRHERRPEEGFSHLVEHMLFKGTGRRTARAIAAELECLGGELNAFTSREYSCYYARAASRHFATTMDVLGDLVLRSSFPASEYTREQQVVLEEIRMYEDSPEELSHELLQSSSFSPDLGHPIVGTADIIGGAPRQAVLDYYHRMYRPGRIFLTVLGNIGEDELRSQLHHFGPLVDGRPGKVGKLRQPRSLTARTLVRKPIEQLHMCYGIRSLSMTHKDRYVLHLINTYLGGGMSSRLFQEIREKRGLAYNVYSFVQSFMDSGLWGFYCASSPANGGKVRSLLQKELDLLIQKGIGARTVSKLKEQMIGSLLLGLEKTSFRMTRLAVGRMYFGDAQPMDRVIALIDAVTPDDVKRVAGELLGRGFDTAVAVGPVPDGAEAAILGGEPTASR